MWRWGGEYRGLRFNSLSGPVLGQLTALQLLYVHTALPAPPEGYRCGVCPFGLTSRFMDVEWWRVFALGEQVVMCVEVLSVAMGW